MASTIPLLEEAFENPHVYLPLELSETQNALVEKFTAAFYTAQNSDKPEATSEIFDDKFLTPIDCYESEISQNGDCILDFLLSKPEESCSSTYETCSISEKSSYETCSTNSVTNNFYPSQSAETWDLDGSCFDTFAVKNELQEEKLLPDNTLSENKIKDERNFWENIPEFVEEEFDEDVLTQAIHSVLNEEDSISENLDSLDLSDIDFCDTLSNSSFDIDNFAADICDENDTNVCDTTSDYGSLTITRNDDEMSNFLRTRPSGSLDIFVQENPGEAYGHLLNNRTSNNNTLTTYNIEEKETNEQLGPNQIVMVQEEALLLDDPLLSSSNINMFPRNHQRHENELEVSSSTEDMYGTGQLQCKWENCYKIYESQAALVFHIEKCHVELKRGDEFTCFWYNCPRQTKPFNARYKLLIHMRVHSGEKPNKCPFKGCNKAFSRLENLKIHQRSHTGERPYLCQFSSCSKSFSNSSDRAKHQRTHFDTKPYACQVAGCLKKYTDPSSLRKHVKNHSYEEQMLLKKKTEENRKYMIFAPKKTVNPQKQKPKITQNTSFKNPEQRCLVSSSEHSYSNKFVPILEYVQNTPNSSINIRKDLKNKISEKRQRRNNVQFL